MNTMEVAAPQAALSGHGQSTWRDWLGIVASIGCAIHCAAMPFVFAYLPALGLSFLADEAFHKWMALVCFLIALAAFVPGLLKHGNWWPAGIGTVGLAAITFAAFGLAGECCPSCAEVDQSSEVAATACSDCEDCENCAASEDPFVTPVANTEEIEASGDEEKAGLLAKLAPWITPFGGLMLVSAHLLNRRCGAICECCDPEEGAGSADTAVQLNASATE
ncbi:MAG: MerC domain-containing protein [Planctomycetota bacterium]